MARALSNRVGEKPVPSTFEYGDLFEQFLILEFIKLNHYLEKRFRFSYFRNENSYEVDLVIEKPNGEILLVEIKSQISIDLEEVRKLSHFRRLFPKAKLYFLSQDENARLESGDVYCLPWFEGLKQIFELPTTL